MKRYVIIQLLVLSCIGSIALAESNRLARVAEPDWMEVWERNFDVCETNVFDSEIISTCEEQGRQILLRIDVTRPYKSENPISNASAYLNDRKLHCSDLVSDRTGKCIRISTIRPRRTLEGFRSVSILENETFHVEFVVFHGPELIRANVFSRKDDVGIEADGWLLWSLARLTPFW